MAKRVKRTGAAKGVADGRAKARAIAPDKAVAQGQPAPKRDAAWMAGGARIWSEEMRRHFDDLAAQSAAVLDQLAQCKTAYDVLKVEQAWLMSRSKAYFDSSVRFASIFAHATRALAAAPDVLGRDGAREGEPGIG
jgi:hypothetical protein